MKWRLHTRSWSAGSHILLGSSIQTRLRAIIHLLLLASSFGNRKNRIQEPFLKRVAQFGALQLVTILRYIKHKMYITSNYKESASVFANQNNNARGYHVVNDVSILCLQELSLFIAPLLSISMIKLEENCIISR